MVIKIVHTIIIIIAMDIIIIMIIIIMDYAFSFGMTRSWENCDRQRERVEEK